MTDECSTPGRSSRGLGDEDGNGDRARGVGGRRVGHGGPDGARDFQGMVSEGDREVDLDTQPPGGSAWSSILTGRLPSTVVR